MCGTGIHQIIHRQIVGIEAHTHILDVDDEHIELIRLFGGRHLRAAVPVKRINRDTGLFVNGIFHMAAGVCVAADTVFRRKNGCDIDIPLRQHIQNMPFRQSVINNARMIGKERHPFS